MTDLPATWDEEPWPLEDPVPVRSLRPQNWSDTHDLPPQVADLADEAWEYAVDRGISMERALAELQRREQYRRDYDRAVLGIQGVSQHTLNGIQRAIDRGLQGPATRTHYFVDDPNDPTRAVAVDLTMQQRAIDRFILGATNEPSSFLDIDWT